MPAGAFLLLGTPGSGGGTPPATPTLSVAGSTATVSGSSAGATNTINVVPEGLGSESWTANGSRTGDGNVTLTGLAPGAYVAVCQSVLGGLPALISNYVGFTVSNNGSRTVTPAGNLPVGHAGIAWLIASSTNFQNLVGAATATAALDHISFESDDTEESGSARPRAIVVLANEGDEERRVALNEFRWFGRFLVSIEAVPPAGILAETPREVRLQDEAQWFENLIQAIKDDCKANEGTGTGYLAGTSQVSCSNIRTLSLGSSEEIRAEGQEGETSVYFYGATLEFTIHG